jgi:hypothetical protein
VQTKQQFLSDLREGKIRYRKIYPLNQTVDIIGNNANEYPQRSAVRRRVVLVQAAPMRWAVRKLWRPQAVSITKSSYSAR